MIINKKIVNCVLFITLVGFLFSCEKIPAAIDLSSNSDSLYFWNEGGETEVKITTNSSTLRAFSEADWLITTVDDYTIKVRALENKGVTSRTTQLKVVAEGATMIINVQQSASSPYLIPNESLVTMPFLEGEKEFFIKTNITSEKWSAICDADWVKVAVDPNINKVTCTVSRNEANQDRQAIIRFSVKNKLLDEVFTLNQEGKPIYYLPYLKWGDTFSSVLSFEEKRGNVVQRIPDGLFFKAWGFQTNSEQFNMIEYDFREGKYFTARLYPNGTYANIAFSKKNMPMLVEFFTKNGFIEERADFFVNKDTKCSALIKRNPTTGLPHIEYNIYAIQPEDYPTLTIEQFLGIFSNYQKGVPFRTPQEYEYEKIHGGILNKEITRSDLTFFDTNPPFLFRYYTLYQNGEMLSTHMGFNDIHYVFFEDEAGNRFFTKEFSKVMNDAGFLLTGNNLHAGRFTFTNQEKGVSFMVFYSTSNFTNGLQRVLTQVQGI